MSACLSDGLTRRQRDALVYIQTSIDIDGIPPSFDEIKDHLGLASKSGVARLVEALEARGWLRRGGYGSARSLTLLKRWGHNSLAKADLLAVSRQLRALSDDLLRRAHESNTPQRVRGAA